MVRFRHLLAASAATCAMPLLAQSPYQQPNQPPGYVNPFAPLSDADQLAQQLRQVASNPTDLYALLNAARLSLKVGDVDAAAALYTRAERVNPMNAQVKAGMARLLVQSGRPGAALRRFQDAERSGASLADFGPDRALAYDLVGEQQRAQREYRALLRVGQDDETIRRYALSLGISGLKEPALALLEPLNRRSDRGAWRARAFVLAMTGDREGADRIATTMMPPGMAQGLAPFFDRLPRLSASERAFAVSFGETRPSPTRLADARMVPSLPALSPEPNPFPQARAPVQVAARDDVDDGKKRKKRPSRKDRERERDAERAERVRVARQPYVAPLPPPPAPTVAQLAALSASRVVPSTFMPAQSAGRVTVLPPPPEAYRSPAAQAAQAASAKAADNDEPDFAVDAVRALTPARQPATALAAATPVTTAPPVTRATSGPQLPAAGPSAGISSFTLPAAPAPSPPAATVSVGTTTQSPAGPPNATQPVATPPPAATGLAATTISPAPGFSGLGLSDPAVSTQAPATLPQSTAASTVAATEPTQPLALAAAVPATAPPAIAPGAEGAIAPTQVVSGPPAPSATDVAAITPTTGAPPPPTGMSGDAVLAAILANIVIPESERNAPAAVAAAPPVAPAPVKLLANIDKKTEVAGRDAVKPVALPTAKVADATLPKKDARGRFVDAKGKPLLDASGRPMGPKGAAAWLAAQSDAPSESAQDRTSPSLPKKDARGRFVDSKGKPLLDARGRPMDAKATAAWKAELAKNGGFAARDLPKRDARGRFVDDKGKPLLDRRGRPLDAKAAAAWKADDAKAPDPAKGEPQRFWVQVAGGANQATLGREWARVSASAASLKGKQGWTTPLRATNRILTGPLKSSAEAMALVNQLKKEGVSAFMFTSDAGQKVSRLGGR